MKISEGTFSEKETFPEDSHEAQKLEKNKVDDAVLTKRDAIEYDPPIFVVEEIDLHGEEVNEWMFSRKMMGDREELFLMDYIGEKEHIILPVSLNGEAITGFVENAFQNCRARTIEIPGYYKMIPEYFGLSNHHVKEIRIGEGVEKIGEAFFSGALNLEFVEASKSVVHLGADSFSLYQDYPSNHWYSKQKDYVIVGSVLLKYKGEDAVLNVPYGIKTIGSRVCNRTFSKVILPNTVTTLSDSAFLVDFSKDAQEFVYSDSLVNIGSRAFGNNAKTRHNNNRDFTIVNGTLFQYRGNDSTVIIPEGVKKIGKQIFGTSHVMRNSSVRKIVFPSSLQEISKHAFENCVGLRTVIFNEGLLRIGEEAFHSCRQLGRVEFPDSLIEISRAAFFSCESIAEVILGESLQTVGHAAFGSCDNLERVHLNNNLQNLESNAFVNCNNLEEISFPSTLMEIGSGAFKGCSSLVNVDVPSTLVTFGDRSFEGTAIEEIALPKKVGEKCFASCENLKHIYFHEEMVSIPKNCFEKCSSITEIEFPKSLSSIDDEAFMECERLNKIMIPKSVKTIGERAFSHCTALDDVTICGDETTYSSNTFFMTPYQVGKIGYFVVEEGVLLQYIGKESIVSIPDDVTEIANNAFSGCEFVESITIPDSVKRISDHIFGDIDYSSYRKKNRFLLSSLIIGNGVESIEDDTFRGCEFLVEVKFGNSIVSIGKSSFRDCTKLSKIDLSGTKVKIIDSDAFSGCSSVKRLSLPEGLELIGDRSFHGIDVEKIILPKSTLKVGVGAFYTQKAFDRELVVYDSIDPEATEANQWDDMGKMNSTLSCAMLGLGIVKSEYWPTKRPIWVAHWITVLSTETGEVKYRVYVDENERPDYRVLMFSAWGKGASFRFHDYDAYFPETISISGRAKMALNRMLYSYDLLSEHRKNYERYLERCLYIQKSARMIAEIIAEHDMVDYLVILTKYNSINKRNAKWILDTLQKTQFAIPPEKSIAYMEECSF